MTPLSPRPARPIQGFTLIELLVVIAIIAVLASLILPGLSGARRTAQNTVGLANLRSMMMLHLVYTTDHHGEFFNPFRTIGEEWRLPLDDSGDPAAQTFAEFTYSQHTRFVGESFAAYWYSYMGLRDAHRTLPVDAGFSPADGDTVAQYRNSSHGLSEALIPSTFYYSPTFYKDPGTFTASSTSCTNEYGAVYRPDYCPLAPGIATRNSMDQVSYPSGKVILFERGDFFQKKRIEIRTGDVLNRPLPPAWNNPRARPGVATVDGSVSPVSIQDLTSLAAEAVHSDNTLTFLPTDLIEAPDLMPVLEPNHAVAIDAPGARDGLYPMFFAATRNGIRGRDLMR